mmetsp:Transcript_32035/g.59228  ORF Transcript_32035/g.59228 Transcript_32035/m.59228 type:complete len:148 (-) Transcript_32035:9-452(-)
MPTISINSSNGNQGPDLSQFDNDIIFSSLKRLYRRKKIRPLELNSKYGHYHSHPLSPCDFDSTSIVLLLGQYSVGKTRFIRHLLGRDFLGKRIGPEPTTDRTREKLEIRAYPGRRCVPRLIDRFRDYRHSGTSFSVTSKAWKLIRPY